MMSHCFTVSSYHGVILFHFPDVTLPGLGYVRQISVCLTSSAVILVPFPIVLLPEVLLAVSAVPGVPGAPSAGSFSALF